MFRGLLFFTKLQVAGFFGVCQISIDTSIRNDDEELLLDGYDVLKGKSLKELKLAYINSGLHEVDFAKDTPQLGVLNFMALLNIAMLLTRSDRAKEVRILIFK